MNRYEKIIHELRRLEIESPDLYHRIKRDIYNEVQLEDVISDIVSYAKEQEWDVDEEKIALMADYVVNKNDSTLSYWENIEASYNSI